MNMPKTAVSAEKRTVSSKITGMKAGRLKSGLPEMRNG